jgi:uncharacterized cupredoxin-like copper-binding protein
MKLRSAALVLVVLAAPACSDALGAQERPVTVRIEYSKFRPDRIQVQAGSRITFIVRNDDPIAHEFLIGDQEVQDGHEFGTEAHHGARDGEVSVAPGETATTSYTFTEPGSLIFGCHLPGHYAYGMKGIIEVV